MEYSEFKVWHLPCFIACPRNPPPPPENSPFPGLEDPDAGGGGWPPYALGPPAGGYGELCWVFWYGAGGYPGCCWGLDG